MFLLKGCETMLFHEKLAKFISVSGIPKTDFAKRVGVSNTTLHKVLKNEYVGNKTLDTCQAVMTQTLMELIELAK